MTFLTNTNALKREKLRRQTRRNYGKYIRLSLEDQTRHQIISSLFLLISMTWPRHLRTAAWAFMPCARICPRFQDLSDGLFTGASEKGT
jgi:hypothetical protein